MTEVLPIGYLFLQGIFNQVIQTVIGLTGIISEQFYFHNFHQKAVR